MAHERLSRLINGVRWSMPLFILGLLLAAPGVRLLAAPGSQSIEEGQRVFQEKCSACHTIGQGGRVGPDLRGVTAIRDKGWLVHWILDPGKMLAEKDPIALELLKKYNNVPMPSMGLTEGEALSVVAYMAAQDQDTSSMTGSQAASPSSGDSSMGRQLFTGALRFQSGGPPCMACHSIAGISALGGGTLGPDLTNAYSRYGEAGISSVLASLPFPTMNPIYSERPLTPEEQANLKAFLKASAEAQKPAQLLIILVVLALVGLAVLLGVFQLIWRRRLTGVRQPMVKPPSSRTL